MMEKEMSEKNKKIKTAELTDGIIVLKPFTLGDIEKHLEGDDVEQQKWLSGGKSTSESVTNWIKRNQKFWEKGGSIFNFAIRTVEDGKLIGMVEANTDWKKIEGVKDGDANISYGLYPEARGKGYTIRAINLMQDFLKEKGIKRIVIRVAPENVNSLRVPVDCGFKEIGQIITEKGDKLIIFIKELQ